MANYDSPAFVIPPIYIDLIDQASVNGLDLVSVTAPSTWLDRWASAVNAFAGSTGGGGGTAPAGPQSFPISG